ncbi:MAG TPA: Holliday junction branch migration DNA helicase RuvB [Spirochaetota bacterium]|nr:Holliday junction branch migration DNA helicase RuvB [Spirochaetota bacterium]
MKKKEENNNPGIISPLSLDEEDFEKKLRPQRLSEFIGQKQLTENLRVFIESAKLRKKPLDHVLLAGPPGLGKTTLAFIVANELGVNIKATSAPAIEKSGDMASLLTNLEAMDVLFIDEIHRLSPAIEELLYSAMEDGELDIILGQGVGAKSIKLQLAPFTMIGATTRTGLLTSALRDRFGIPLRLDYYEIDDLETIALRTATIIGCSIEEEAAQEIARRSRRTPRIVNRLVKRVLDFAIVHKKDMIDKQIALYALDKLHIDMLGLDDMDRKILSTIIDKYDGGPVGIKTIAISIGEEMTTLEDFYEPYLVQIGMLKRTPRGRVAARLAYEHLGLAYKGIEDIQTLFE